MVTLKKARPNVVDIPNNQSFTNAKEGKRNEILALEQIRSFILQDMLKSYSLKVDG